MWRCFHCDFETFDIAEAAAHFGDRDDAEEFKPLCRWWRRMSPDERGQILQDTIKELNAERDENALLRTRIDGLEYQVEGIAGAIASRFKGCRTIDEAWHKYDSMEGRALSAEEKLRAVAIP